MILDARVTIYDPTAATVQILDASADLNGGQIQYEDTPSGCGAGKLTHGLHQEEIVNRGYYSGMNVVEISTGDNTLQAPIAPGTGTITVTGPTSTSWSISTNPFPVTSGTQYTIDFYATISTNGNAGAFYVIDGTQGYAKQYVAINLTNTSGQQHLSYTFTPTSSSVIVAFQANGGSFTSGSLAISNVTLQTVAYLINGTGNNFTNIVQGSPATNIKVTVGTTKLYIDAGFHFDPTLGEDGQQAYLWDGTNLTMRIPVTLGSDTGGAYLLTGAPLAGGGNPTSIAAYAQGAIVGRRRYCGRIVKRSITNQRQPGGDITLVGMSVGLTQVTDTITISIGANVDSGAALLAVLQKNATRWPFYIILATNFPTVGSIYSGTATDQTCDQIISDILTKIPTGDQWVLRIGHDRVPRLVRLYTSSTNTYAYSVSLQQGVSQYEAQSVSLDDQDVTAIFNSVKVVGDTDPVTKQPVAAIVQDATSIAFYGLQIDAAPVTNTGVKDTTGAANYGLGLLNGSSIARASDKLTVYTRNDYQQPLSFNPGGVTDGDVIRGSACVLTLGFDQLRSSTNFVPDSEIRYATGATPLWTAGNGGMSVASGVTPTGGNSFYLSTSTTSSRNYEAGPMIPVVPGQSYLFTGSINASAVTAGNPQWLINQFGGGTLGGVSQAPGSNGSPTPIVFVVPAGVYAIQILAYTNGCTSSGSSVQWAAPLLTLGSRSSPYAPNYAAPTIYGLVSSVTSTVDLASGDRWQDAQFSAVEPDWNAAISEKANAALTAAQANRVTPLAIDQYVVSSGAFAGMVSPTITGWSTSSLAVTTPTFLALFAANSALVTVGGGSPSFTLSPGQTTWAWINSSGLWSLQNSAAVVPGAILYGIFQTTTSGVIGFLPKAPLGVIKVGYGNVNVATSFPAPSVSWAVTNGYSINGIAADITASATISNVPTDSSVGQVLFLHRLSGQSPAAAWVPDAAVNVATNSPTQTITFDYGALDNGASYDFACAFVGLAGYGALSNVYTGFAAKTIVIPTPYLLGGSTTPTVSGTTTFTPRASVAGLACTINVSFTANNQPTDGSLSRIALFYRVSGSSAFTPYGSFPAGNLPTPSASQGYSVDFVDLTNGVTYDFGFAYENAQGGESATFDLGTATALTIAISAPYMLGGTAITPNVTSPTLSPAASVTGLTATVAIGFTLTNQPTDGSLSRLTIWYKPGSASWQPLGSFPAAGVGTTAPSASATYSYNANDLTNGIAYTFGVSYENTQGGESAVGTIGSITAQTIAIATPYLLGGTSITPSVTSVSVAAGTSANGISAAATVAFTTTNQPVDGSLSRLNLWVRPGGTSTWSPYSGQPAGGVGLASPAASYSYSILIADLTNGISYDFGVSYENAQGGESAIATISSNYAAAAVNVPVSSIAGIPTLIATNGPNVTAATTGTYVNDGGGSFAVPAVFSIGDWTAGNAPPWFAGFQFYWRQHSPQSAAIDAGSLGVVSIVSNISKNVSVPSGIGYDLGVAYIGGSQTYSAITWPGGWSNFAGRLVNPVIAIAGSTSVNLVKDPNFDYSYTYGSGFSPTYWTCTNLDGTSFALGKGGNTDASGVENYLAVHSGAGTTVRTASTKSIFVTTGQAYTISCYLDLTTCGSGPGFQLQDQSGNVLATASQTSGKNGRVSATVSSIAASVTAIHGVFTNAGVAPNSGMIVFATPQIEIGSVMTAYKPGAIVDTLLGTITHQAESAQTQATIASTVGSDGSYLQPSTVAGRHLLGGTIGDTSPMLDGTGKVLLTRHNSSVALDSTGNQMNLVTDGDFQYGGTYWNVLASGVTFASNAGAAGTGIIGAAYWTVSGTNAAFQSGTFIPCAASTTYTISVFWTDQTAAGSYSGNATMYVADQSGTKLLTYPLPNGGGPGKISASFTTGSSSTSFVAQFGNGTSTFGAGYRIVQQVQIEPGSISTSFKRGSLAPPGQNVINHGAHSLPTQATIGAAVGSDGSYLSPGVAFGRHLAGGATNDYGALMGSGLLLHTRHSQPVQNTISTAVGAEGSYLASSTVADRHLQKLASSTFLNNQLSLNTYADGTVSYTPSTTSANAASITFSWSAFNIRFSDGSSLAVSASSATISGFSGSSTVYVCGWFSKTQNTSYTNVSVGTGYLMFTATTSVQSAAFVQSINKDGNQSFFANRAVSTPVAPASGTSMGGSGGGGAYCPAVWQLIETRERGFARADEIAIGEHVRGALRDEWNRVESAIIDREVLVRVTVAGEDIDVEIGHLWLLAGGDPHPRSSDWIRTADLTIGTLLDGRDPATGEDRPSSVDGVKMLGYGKFVRLQVENNRLVVGRVVSHNFVTT